jgi:aminoglycoside phosphotransferase (APT) family kinase protein
MIVVIEQLRPLLRDLELAEAISIAEMAGGSSPVFRIELASGERLVKTYTDLRAKTPGKEAFAARQLSDLGIPITRYLMLDETQTRLPFRFALTNHLPGVTAGSLRDHPGISAVYRDMGALLRQLHTVRMEGYGAFDADGVRSAVKTNAEFLHAIIAHAFERFRHYGGDEALASQLRRILDRRFDDVVASSAGPVFAHDDLHPNNVLVIEAADGTLALSGLIDFGNAHAADAVHDLAKCLFCAMHEAPDCRMPMLERYGAIDHPDPEGALWYYTLLHRVIMWWWLRHVGTLPTADAPSGLIDDLRHMAEGA